MAEEVVAAETAVAAAVSPPSPDHKRKLEDLEPQEPLKTEPVESNPTPTDLPIEESEVKPNDVENPEPEAKRPRLEEEESDGSVLENGHEVKSNEPATENAPNTAAENIETSNADHETGGDLQTENVKDQPVENPQNENEQKSSEDDILVSNVQQASELNLQQPTEGKDVPSPPQPAAEIPQQVDISSTQQQRETGIPMSRKMEVPNTKVGVLIGKSGDTIRFLQYNSGAKIQITRDTEADPQSTTRPVELIGTLENINKAERLIKDVIAEAEAGGSPSLVARGFGNAQCSGVPEQIQIQVPNERVGLIIGKGGETIKNLQTKSGARIQLIPQHLPEGDQSRERTVRVTGDKKQIDAAKEMIKEVMSQPIRSSSHSGGYNQHHNRPRGPSGGHHWGPRGPPNAQATGYDYQQRGMYPSQNPQYMPQNYGGYPQQQPTPRNNYNAGWEQRPSGPMQTGPQGSGYDYYAQGGHAADPATAPANTAPAGGPPTQVNYNYGQPQGPDYGQQPSNYPQSAPAQQNYGHGYEDPKYGNQVATQPAYGGHGNAQAGAYPQQVSNQHGYVQQPYSKQAPTYGMPSQGPAAQTYGPPRTGQPGDASYQNPPAQSYGPSVPSQQQYPYPSTGPAQQTYPYGSVPVGNDGYSQQPHTGPTPVYPQQGVHAVSGYGQPGGQAAPGYGQGGQAAAYGAYPSAAQQGYAEQAVATSGGYGYQGPPADAGYGGTQAAAYGVAPNPQANYVQPTPNQPVYEQQPIAQSGGYAAVAESAPVGYAKNLSSQPVYGQQYDTTQMYGGHH